MDITGEVIARLRPARRAPRPEIAVGGLLLRHSSSADTRMRAEEVVSSLAHLSPWMPWAPAYRLWLGRAHTGRGVASLAAAALTHASLQLRGVTRVQIHHDPANERSGAVARRLGYRQIRIRPAARLAPAHTGTLALWRMEGVELGASAARVLLDGARP